MSTFIPLKSGAVYYLRTYAPLAPYSRLERFSQSVHSYFKCKKITVSNGSLKSHIVKPFVKTIPAAQQRFQRSFVCEEHLLLQKFIIAVTFLAMLFVALSPLTQNINPTWVHHLQFKAGLWLCCLAKHSEDLIPFSPSPSLPPRLPASACLQTHSLSPKTPHPH